MIIVDYSTKKVLQGKMWQYSYGQVLRIQGGNLNKVQEIQFAIEETGADSMTRFGVTKDGVTDVVIPDTMLENNDSEVDYPVYVFIYNRDETSGETVDKFVLNVLSRSKPEHTGGSDDGDTFGKVIEEVNNASDRAETAEKQAGEYAKQTKADAQQTTQDREEVERLVKSVEHITDDVETVRQYKEQAQTAATNALLSEQKSEQAKELTLRAQACAETAESMAEQHALETAGDKSEVERLATQVRTDKQIVEQNKASVEQTVHDFALTAQQALADVNNAGQTQVDRVQDTCKKAVEEVQTAQRTATDAIETAKVEAVKNVQAEGATQVGKATEEGEKQVQAVQAAAQEIIADRGQIQENKDGIAELMQGKANAIIETATGNLITVKDSSGAYVENLTVHGKTEQVQTTGKNLLDIESGIVKGFDITEIKNTLIAGKTYTYSVTSLLGDSTSKCALLVCFTDGTEQNLTGYLKVGTNKTFICPEKEIAYIKLGGINASTLDKSCKLQIEAGSSASEWETYTGGKPSPSIEYKQEITSIGQTGSVVVKVRGKNLLNIKQYELISSVSTLKVTINDNNDIVYTGSDSYSGSGMLFKGVEPGTYTISVEGDIGLASSELLNDKFFANSYWGAKGLPYMLKKVDGECTVISNAKFDLVIVFKQTTGTIKKLQFEPGNKATEYEKWKGEQTITLKTPNGLPGIPVLFNGNYTDENGQQRICDYVDCAKGKYAKRCYFKTFDGSEDEEWSIYGKTAHTFKSPFNGIIVDGLCSHYIKYGSDEIDKKNGIYLHNTVSFIITNMNVNTLEEWKEKLQENPITIVCAAKAEELIDLTSEEIEAYKALHTYNPATTIANDAGAHMEVEYVADTKKWTENKLTEIVTAHTQGIANLLSLMPLSVQAGMVETDVNNILEDMEVQKHE